MRIARFARIVVRTDILAIFKNISVDVEVARGECDKLCDDGGQEPANRKIRYIKCKDDANSDNRICDKKIYIEDEECKNLTKCQPAQYFGKWSCWSECSRPCVERADEPSMKTRSRVCLAKDKSKCAGQTVQSKECKNIPECRDKGMYLT